METPRFEVIGLRLPVIEEPTDLARLIVEAAAEQAGGIRDGDIIVVTSKLYLKSVGEVIDLSRVRPRLAARIIARICGKNPVETELVLRCTKRILAVIPLEVSKSVARALAEFSADPERARKVIKSIGALLLVVTKNNLVALDAGLDYSNLPPGKAIAHTIDFDEAARRLRQRIEELSGKRIGVVLTDTESLLVYRPCSIDIAVGASGIPVVSRKFAELDVYGKPKFGGVDCIADEVASAAALLMGQTSERVPVVIVRGLNLPRIDEEVKRFCRERGRRFSAKMWLKTALARLVFALSSFSRE